MRKIEVAGFLWVKAAKGQTQKPPLEKKVFIHYKKGHTKPPEAGKLPKAPSCYGFLGKWVKWQTLSVNYAIDPKNPGGLTQDFITSAIFASAEEWDKYTGSELFNNTYTIINDGSWDSDAPDGRNELVFGNYPDPDVIAVTVVWGYFSGPPSTRKIIEFDVLYDTDFTWGRYDFKSSSNGFTEHCYPRNRSWCGFG